MIECVFCYSSSKDNYIFTECNHLVCIDCASAKWDHRYSLKCCNQLTFLAQQTSEALQSINQTESKLKALQSKQNNENAFQPIKSPLSRSRNQKEELEQSYCQRVKLEESVLIKEFVPKSASSPCEEEIKEKEQNLNQMEKILSQEVTKIKCAYEYYRKQLQRKEQNLLKQLYTTYSDHLNGLKSSYSQQDVNNLKEKLVRLSCSESQRQPSARQLEKEKEEGKPDKILQKLDYNQQKMKEKLHKHYEMLK